MAEKANFELDSLDLRMLRELRLDGRQPASHLADKLGISRTYACERLDRLLSARIARVGAFTNAVALGYRALAVTAIQVAQGESSGVADRLRALPNVIVVIIGVGWQDILIWSLFPDQSGLYDFMTRELAGVPGIESAETLVVIESFNASPYLYSEWESLTPHSHSFPSMSWDSRQATSADLLQQGNREGGLSVDKVDLLILREIEKDGRQPVAHVARRLGISRANASARLKRLLDEDIARITTFVSPRGQGNQIFALIGMKVSPREVNTVVERVKTLRNVGWVAKVVGRHNVLVGTTLLDPLDLLELLERQLGPTPGILSMETMVGLEIRKRSYAYLASAYLKRIEECQQ